MKKPILPLNRIPFLFLLLTFFITSSCDNSDKNSEEETTLILRLSVVEVYNSCGLPDDFLEPTSCLLTLRDSEGNLTFDMAELVIERQDYNSFTTTEIQIAPGSYTVVDFIVLDQFGKSMYITPLTNSDFAEIAAITNPYDFDVIPGQANSIVQTVVSSYLGELNQFGYEEGSISRTDLADGLVAFFPFDGNANDQSGNELNGVVKGAVLTTDRHGVENSAYLFVGDKDVITVDDSDLLDITDNLTLSVWVNLMHGKKRGSIIIDKTSSMPYEGFQLGLYNANNSEVEFINTVRFVGNQHSNHITADELIRREWTHIATTYSSGVVKIYINGILESTTEEPSDQLTTHHEDLQIGNHIPNFGSDIRNSFHGRIDEVRIYNRILSSCEIEILAGQ